MSPLVSLFLSWQFATSSSRLLFSFNPRLCTLSSTGCIRPARRKFFDSDSFATFAWGSVWRVSLVVLSKPPYLRRAYCRARRPGLGRSFAPSGSVLQQEGNSTNLQIFSRLIPSPRLTLSLTYIFLSGLDKSNPCHWIYWCDTVIKWRRKSTMNAKNKMWRQSTLCGRVQAEVQTWKSENRIEQSSPKSL